MSIDFNSKTTYGDDDDKYIKAKIKNMPTLQLQIFIIKNANRKSEES